MRQDSWERLARPRALARLFHKRGVAMAGLLVVTLTLFFALIAALRPVEGAGFYAFMAHNVMIVIFIPAFVAPLALIGLSLRDYWREVGGGRVRLRHLRKASDMAGRMRNLNGGHGDGCNFDDGARFSQKRRIAHQLMMLGLLACFAATSSGTILHYVFGWYAPYSIWAPPKLLGAQAELR